MSGEDESARRLFIFSLCLVAFAYGFLSGSRQLFPYPQLEFAIASFGDVWSQKETLLGTSPTEFIRDARHEGDGVTVRKAEASPGLTLLSGFFDESNEIRLVSLDGAVVRRWRVSYFDLFPTQDHVDRPPATEWNVDVHGALALPDGSVVFNFEYGGLVKLDRCGAESWTVPHMTHHSIEISERGGYWVGGRRVVRDSTHLPPYLGAYEEDLLLRVSPEGEIVDEISVPRFLLENGLAGVLTASGSFGVNATGRDNPRYLGEIVHLNDIEELPTALAADFPQFAPGDLLLSLRHRNLLVVIDPDRNEVKWHQTGPWIRQHDPDWQPGGVITVFNNNTDESRGRVFGGSNVMGLDPRDGSVEVLYGRGPDEEMYTRVRGKHQVLPNGNLLLTVYDEGRVIEVGEAGDVVWQYVNRYDDASVATVNDALRYPPDYFEGVDWECE